MAEMTHAARWRKAARVYEDLFAKEYIAIEANDEKEREFKARLSVIKKFPKEWKEFQEASQAQDELQEAYMVAARDAFVRQNEVSKLWAPKEK